MDTIDRIRAFDAKHGPECYSDGSAIYFRDGSYRERSPMGLLYDVALLDKRLPDIEWAVTQNVVTFYRLKLKQAVDQFDELQTVLAHSVPADPDAELAKLQRLQVVVTQRQAELAKAEGALAETQWGRARLSARKS